MCSLNQNQLYVIVCKKLHDFSQSHVFGNMDVGVVLQKKRIWSMNVTTLGQIFARVNPGFIEEKVLNLLLGNEIMFI